MSSEIKAKIIKRTLELSAQPAWLSLLKPLDHDDFPGQASIEELIRSGPPSPLYTKFNEALRSMGITERDQYRAIGRTLFSLWQLKIGGKSISDNEVTIKDVRDLNVYDLSVIDGLDEKGLFGPQIAQKLFK